MRVKFGVLEQTQGLHLHVKFHVNVFIVSASGGQKPQFWANFDILGTSEIWHGGGDLVHTKFHPNRCNVSPLRGEKHQNQPLSKLNTGGLRCAQCCR